MPVTRSASQSSFKASNHHPTKQEYSKKHDSDPASLKKSPKKASPRTEVQSTSKAFPTVSLSGLQNIDAETNFVPAVLSFSLDNAKQHLMSVDHRFASIFEKMQCKPFENLERVHPFRALATSIIGQQISWMAARSINYKFLRLFDPSLPETPADYSVTKQSGTFFPSPFQVASTSIAALKTAGLSTRKAEYIQDLAARFADGRLSTEKLIAANDEELAEMLIEVRGIGRWTVDMFAIFSLRRPDILPVGDLGVQRGLLRWFLSRHSSHSFSISPAKVSGQQTDDKKLLEISGKSLPDLVSTAQGTSTQPVLDVMADASLEKEEAILTTPSHTRRAGAANSPMPVPFTPSINQTLFAENGPTDVAPLPAGLSVSALKSRLDGKKKIKGAFLTPQEMEDLTDAWKPYRSIGVYYMWSLAEAGK